MLIITSCSKTKVMQRGGNKGITGQWRVVNYILIHRLMIPEKEAKESFVSCTQQDVTITDSSIRFPGRGDCYPNIDTPIQFSFVGRRSIEEDSLVQGERFIFYVYKRYRLTQIPVYRTSHIEPNCLAGDFIEIYMINDEVMILPFCDEALIVLKRYQGAVAPKRDAYEPYIRQAP